jgi:hypothetical protein
MTSIALPTEDTTRAATAHSFADSPPFKRPLSAKRLAANRANAKKSTGPRTQKGKHKVSQNATTHALTSTRCPDPRASNDFDTLRRELEEEHHPTTPTQHALLRELAFVLWKLRHIPAIEDQLLNTPLHDDDDSAPDDLTQDSALRTQDLYSSTIAAHFQANTPTPLTRIYAHHHRLQSRMTTILRLLGDLKKRHQLQLKEQQELEDDLRRSRLNQEERLARQRDIERWQRDQKARQRQDAATPSPGTPGEGRGEGPLQRTSNAPTAQSAPQSLASSPATPSPTSNLKSELPPAQNKPTNPLSSLKIPDSVPTPTETNPPQPHQPIAHQTPAPPTPDEFPPPTGYSPPQQAPPWKSSS